MQLQWQLVQPPLVPHPRGCAQDLADVCLVAYGLASRVWSWFDDVEPWRCLTIFTTAGSLDFIFEKEEDAGYLIVALTHFCQKVRGFPLPGGIATLARFNGVKGWCKVYWTCRHKGVSLASLCLKAMQDSNSHYQTLTSTEAYGMLDSQEADDVEAAQSPGADSLPPQPELEQEVFAGVHVLNDGVGNAGN